MALAEVSQYRLAYWHTTLESQFLRVVRDFKGRSDRWAIFDGEAAWTGEVFTVSSEGRYDAYRWSEAEALEIAEDLALKMNSEIIGVMDRRFPGEFSGGPYDLSARPAARSATDPD